MGYYYKDKREAEEVEALKRRYPDVSPTLIEAFSMERLYEAHRLCRRSKSHKREVVSFEINLYSNLAKIQKGVLEKSFEVDKYRVFDIYEPKQREIESLSYKDRVVQNCLCNNILKGVFEKMFIYDNGACRFRKGTDFCRKRFRRFLNQFYREHDGKGYVLKCDISKYFANINYDILSAKLQKHFDEDTLWLMQKFLRVGERDKGIPIGNQTSQWFALFYMNEIDHYIKKELKIKYYVRYMDDFLLLHHDKAYLQEVYERLRERLADIHLSLNRKTKIYRISDGIGFLGFKYRFHDGVLTAHITNTSKKRIRKNIAKNHIKSSNNLIDKSQEYMFDSNMLKYYFMRGDDTLFLFRTGTGRTGARARNDIRYRK